MLVVTQPILHIDVLRTTAHTEDAGLGELDCLSMTPLSQFVACEKDPASCSLFNDPDVIVELLFDLGAVGLPQGHDLETQLSKPVRKRQATQTPVDEELRRWFRRLRAAACRRHE